MIMGAMGAKMVDQNGKRTDYYSLEAKNGSWTINGEFQSDHKIKWKLNIEDDKKASFNYPLSVSSMDSLKSLRLCIDKFIELVEQQKESEDED